MYLPNDGGEYTTYATGNKPYATGWTHTCNELLYMLRLSGVAVDCLDDQTLVERIGGYRQIVIPASMALAEGPARRLAAFVEAGGTLVLAGPVGLTDPWLERDALVGGPAWAGLGWQAPQFTEKRSPAVFAGQADVFRGTDLGTCDGGVAMQDANGLVVGWSKAWGKGRVVASGIFPDTYGADPHPPRAGMAWLRQLLDLAAIPVAAVWEDATPAPAGAPAGRHGEGMPVVEVVVRARKDAPERERFVFVLNQGGAGDGRVSVALTKAPALVSDALSGQSVPQAVWKDGRLSIPLPLKAWEYRIFRLSDR
jgi:hypothetical protein